MTIPINKINVTELYGHNKNLLIGPFSEVYIMLHI